MWGAGKPDDGGIEMQWRRDNNKIDNVNDNNNDDNNIKDMINLESQQKEWFQKNVAPPKLFIPNPKAM